MKQLHYGTLEIYSEVSCTIIDWNFKEKLHAITGKKLLTKNQQNPVCQKLMSRADAEVLKTMFAQELIYSISG